MMRIVQVTLLAVALSLAGCQRAPTTPSAVTPPLAPPVVLYAVATPAASPAFGQVIARLDGSATTPVHSPVTGFLIQQAYTDGAMVKKGDLLFVVNPKPFAPSAKKNSGYVRITSPLDGFVGKAVPGLGDAVTPDSILATVATIDPIVAEFPIPVAYYHARTADFALPKEQRSEEFELILPDGSTYPEKGRLDLANEFTSGINSAVSARALFSNKNHVLRPGQYAKISDRTGAANGAVTIPRPGIRLDPDGAHVKVVKPGNTVEVRKVIASPASGATCTVTSGLKAGECVIVSGGEKCGEGDKVEPKPYEAPATGT